MGLLAIVRRWFSPAGSGQPPALPSTSAIETAACSSCDGLRGELASERELRAKESAAAEETQRALEDANRMLADANRTAEDNARDLDRLHEELVECVRVRHSTEVALAAMQKVGVAATGLTPTPPGVTGSAPPSSSPPESEPSTAKSTDAPPKRPMNEGRGRRIAELERLLSESEDRCERYRHRAEDAERDVEVKDEEHQRELREQAEAHGRELAELRKEMARDRDTLRRDLRDAEKRARGAAQRVVDQPESLRNTPRPGGVASSLAEVYWSPGDDCTDAIRTQIERASRSIDVCVFTITDDRLADAVLAAHRSGIRVRVLTDNDKAEDRGSDIGRFERAGIAVRVDHTEHHMHHKFAIFDGRIAITGSYNWTRSAARYNEEHVVVTDEPRLVKKLSRGFETLWERHAPKRG